MQEICCGQHLVPVQALFRPVSMCVPDLNLICEIMLMAEGFQQSKALSRKFVILYRLCEDLLSKSKHYDWKLRAIKTTLYVAGGMKRQAPHLSEDKARGLPGTPLLSNILIVHRKQMQDEQGESFSPGALLPKTGHACLISMSSLCSLLP